MDDLSDLSRGPAPKHLLYGTWNGIRSRCLNPNFSGYEYWGGRGIRIHELWIDDFWAFADWVTTNLGPRPEGHTLDRYPDVNGDYEPGNLRWATAFEQMQNTRAQLDPMNGVQQDSKTTWCYQITRGGELYAEYGFASPEDAAAARDHVLAMLDADEDALAYIQQKKDARRDLVEAARRKAQDKQDAARKARDDATRARKEARALEQQAKREDRQDRKNERAQRWQELNRSGMSLAEIGRAEGVTTACVSITLKNAGLPVALHNSTGYPGVKKVTKKGRVYYEARMTVDGKRKTLGQRKTPELAYELIVVAKAPTPVPEAVADSARPRRTVEVGAGDTAVRGTPDSGGPDSVGRPRRTVLVRAA